MLYAGVVGAVLVVAGIIGFFYNAELHQPTRRCGTPCSGVLDVNGWHNLVHILTGVLGLLAFGAGVKRRRAATRWRWASCTSSWRPGDSSSASGDSILGIIPVNTEDNILHLMLGVAGVWAGAMPPRQPRPCARRHRPDRLTRQAPTEDARLDEPGVRSSGRAAEG